MHHVHVIAMCSGSQHSPCLLKRVEETQEEVPSTHAQRKHPSVTFLSSAAKTLPPPSCIKLWENSVLPEPCQYQAIGIEVLAEPSPFLSQQSFASMKANSRLVYLQSNSAQLKTCWALKGS